MESLVLFSHWEQQGYEHYSVVDVVVVVAAADEVEIDSSQQLWSVGWMLDELERVVVVVVAVVATQLAPSVAEPVAMVAIVLVVLQDYLLHLLSQTLMPHQDFVPRHLFELEQPPEPKYSIFSSK